MREYLRLLESQKASGQDIRIEFDRIPIDKLKTRTPGKLMGLQLADAAAGAFFNAIERDNFGNTEPRYLNMISPVIYRHEKNIQGYGLKIVPRETMQLLPTEESLKWLAQFK